MKKIIPNDFSSISNFDIMKRIQNAKKKKRPCSMNRKRINKSQEEILSKSSLKTQNSTLFKNEIKTSRENNNVFTYLNDPEIDSEILDLFKQYYETKTSRKQSEDTFNHFNNKLNMLHKEEEKTKEREKLLRKNYERMEKIQFKNLEEKELIMRNKERMEKLLKQHKINNELYKNKRDNTLKNFRKDIAKNNFDIISKIKEKRKISEEIKKENEYEKKLKLKNELLKKIQNEEERKKIYEEQCNKCQNESIEVLNRIKNIDEEIEKEKNWNNF